MKRVRPLLWLLVVVQALAIIAVLAARVHYEKLPHMPVTRIHADIHGGLKTILEIFEADCGRFPTTAEGWKVLLEMPADSSMTNWHGPYFDPATAPKDPWGREYVYRFPGIYNTNGYDLYSCGSDGSSKSGGNDLDDINNWDEASPRGGEILDHWYGEERFAQAARILLIIPFLFGMKLVVEKNSPRIRGLLGVHRRADAAWLLLAIVAVLIWFSAVGPRLAER